MNRRIGAIGLVLILSLVVGILGFAKKDAFWGEGTRISVLFGFPDEISADEPCWVRHGVWTAVYPGYQPDIKAETGDRKAVDAGRVKFELFINGERIKLQVQQTVVPGDEPGTSIRQQHYYIQFEPYHFEPGVYEFVGVWTGMNPNTGIAQVSPYVRTLTLTVLEP